MLLLIITMGQCNELTASKMLILEEKNTRRYTSLSLNDFFKIQVIKKYKNDGNIKKYIRDLLDVEIADNNISEMFEKLLAFILYNKIKDIYEYERKEFDEIEAKDIFLDYKNIISKYADVFITNKLKRDYKLKEEDKAKINGMSTIDALTYLIALEEVELLEKQFALFYNKFVKLTTKIKENSNPIEKYFLLKKEAKKAEAQMRNSITEIVSNDDQFF